jgi:hypothetical protein
MRYVCVSDDARRAVAMETYAKRTIKFDAEHDFVLSLLKAHQSPVGLPMSLRLKMLD